MKTYVIANWKMNPPTLAEAEQLVSRVSVRRSDKVEVVLCPPVYFLSSLSIKYPSVIWGSQNCFWESRGAYTGETSTEYLRTHGAKLVILGHSERRLYLQESNEIVARKLKHVLKENLVPVLCLGGGVGITTPRSALEAVLEQLASALATVPGKSITDGRLVVTYEPAWAIGSGKVATSKHIAEAAFAIRQHLARHYGTMLSETIPILYGGSVNAEVVPGLKKKSNLQGYLVGGASLNATEFIKIIGLS